MYWYCQNWSMIRIYQEHILECVESSLSYELTPSCCSLLYSFDKVTNDIGDFRHVILIMWKEDKMDIAKCVRNSDEYKKEKIMIPNIHIDDNGNIFAFDRRMQAIIMMDKGFRNFCYVKGIAQSDISLYWNAVESYLDNGIIWIGSVNRPDLLKYDVKRNKFSYVANPLVENNESNALYDIIKYKKKLFVLARSFKNCSYVFDMETETYKAIHLVDENSEIYSKNCSFFHLNGNMLYLPVIGDNKIVKYCLDEIFDKMKYDIITLKPEIKIVCMRVEDDNLYLSSSGDSDIHIFNANGGYAKINGCDKRADVDFYCQIISNEKYIIALPRHGDKVLIYNKDEEKISYVKLPYSDGIIKNKNQGSLCHEYYISKDENMLYLFPWEYEFISQINLKTLEIETFDASIKKKDYALYKYENIKHDMEIRGVTSFVCNESDYIDLNEYLLIIAERVGDETIVSKCKNIQVGEEIYFQMKGL